MNVHRSTEARQVTRQEASCLMEEASAAAQKKAYTVQLLLVFKVLLILLGPRNDGMISSS